MSRPRIVAIIQARMGSTRLPGKTLADICGKPLLARVIERIRAAQTVDAIVLATTSGVEDQPLLDLALRMGVQAFAGSAEDVLDRFYQAARLADAEVIVRVTADDPFKDPRVLDEIVEYFFDHEGTEYASNTLRPSYPEGLDIEVFTFGALERAWNEATLPSEREHVTPYIWKNPGIFKTANVRYSRDLSGMRWTVDYEQDLQFAREVYRRLDSAGVFGMENILALLEREPELARINQGFERNAGYKRSQEQETRA